MAQYSDSHHQPSNSQLGHWGGYYIPKVLPGQGSMPMSNNHGIQPMETAEQDVQQQGTQYLPIPTVISGRQQETAEREDEDRQRRDRRSFSRGRSGQNGNSGHHGGGQPGRQEHGGQPGRQEHGGQPGRQEHGGRRYSPEHGGYGRQRQRSRSSCYSDNYEQHGHYQESRGRPSGNQRYSGKQRGGQGGNRSKPPPQGKKKTQPPPKTGKETKESKEAASKQPPKSTGVVFSTVSKQIINSSMLPSDKWCIEEGLVHFQEGDSKISFPKTLPEEKVYKGKEFVFPMRPSLMVDSLERATLPEPAQGDHPTLLTNHWLYLKPRAKRCPHHAGGGLECSCTLQGVSGQYHRGAVLNDTCLKKDYITPPDVAVAPKGLLLQENAGRYYQWNEEAGDHLLGVPTPFLIGGQWPGLPYEPAMAQGQMDDRTRLYYTLYSPERFREVASIYLNPPSEWDEGSNPVFGEPSPQGELGQVARTLYGVETLARTGFCAHPCAEPRILLFCAVMKEDRMVPVYHTDRSAPLRVEAAVTEILRPWHEGGLGQILCSVCIVQTGPHMPTQLMWLSRSEYMLHWEAEHASSMVASNVFSASQLHVRIHLGHLAYILALAGRLNNKENPLGVAVSTLAMERFHIIMHDEVLKDFLGPASDEDLEQMFNDHDIRPASNSAAEGPASMDALLPAPEGMDEQNSEQNTPAGKFLPPKNNKKKK